MIMRTSSCLGPLDFLEVWHDSSGDGGEASWFLDKIVVRDLVTDDVYVL